MKGAFSKVLSASGDEILCSPKKYLNQKKAYTRGHADHIVRLQFPIYVCFSADGEFMSRRNSDQWLLSGHTNTHRTDCSVWTIKLVGL